MCYFIAVGAKAPRRVLAQVFEEHGELELGAVAVCSEVASTFPSSDEVGLVTWRGCSCDLLGRAVQLSKTNTGALTLAFQRGVMALARELGSVRLIVHRHAGRPSAQCRKPAPRASFRLEVHELLKCERWFIEDVLIEVQGRSNAPILVS